MGLLGIAEILTDKGWFKINELINNDDGRIKVTSIANNRTKFSKYRIVKIAKITNYFGSLIKVPYGNSVFYSTPDQLFFKDDNSNQLNYCSFLDNSLEGFNIRHTINSIQRLPKNNIDLAGIVYLYEDLIDLVGLFITCGYFIDDARDHLMFNLDSLSQLNLLAQITKRLGLVLKPPVSHTTYKLYIDGISDFIEEIIDDSSKSKLSDYAVNSNNGITERLTVTIIKSSKIDNNLLLIKKNNTYTVISFLLNRLNIRLEYISPGIYKMVRPESYMPLDKKQIITKLITGTIYIIRRSERGIEDYAYKVRYGNSGNGVWLITNGRQENKY